jgi:hypothetical protein
MRKSRHHAGQAGQAYAEYQILYPAGILLAILAVVAIGGGVRDLMDHGIEGLMYSFLGGSAPGGSYYHPGMVCVEREDIINQDSGGSFCEDHTNCYHYDYGVSQGTFTIPEGEVDALVIKAGQEYHLYESGLTKDGCYSVTIDESTVTWKKVGDGGECKDISHLQMWWDAFISDSEEMCANWETKPPPY